MVSDDDPFEDDNQAAAARESADGDGPVQNQFRDVFAFVDDFLAHVYARELRSNQGFRWCAKWHHHPEALTRLEALWIAFEAMRQDETTGRAAWWLQYADPMMLTLCDPSGPFRACSSRDGTHEPPAPLPTTSRFVDVAPGR